MNTETFPIDLSSLQPLKLDPAISTLTDAQKADLRHNIQLCRDAIVFFTALAGARGLSGHTGGAYDTVPEVMIVRAFIADGAPIVPIFYDEAGHRVATQYLLSVLNGAMPAEKLLHYREYDSGLPGHPEKAADSGRRVQLRPARPHVGLRATASPWPIPARPWCCSAPTAARWKATTPKRRASPSASNSTSKCWSTTTTSPSPAIRRNTWPATI